MARVYFDKRLKWWCLDYIDAHGKRHQVKAARTKTPAQYMLQRKMGEIAKEKLFGTAAVRNILFDDLVTEYLQFSRCNKRLRSYEVDIMRAGLLLKVFGGKRVTEITVKDVETYKGKRSTEVKPATVNRELALLKHMFSKAIQWGYARENPVRQVKLFKENNAIVRNLTPQEKDRPLAYCSARIRPIVITALHTGMRKGEIFNLTWSDVDLEKGIITVRDSKNHETRYIPINRILKETLQDVIRNIDDPRVFWNTVNFRKSGRMQ